LATHQLGNEQKNEIITK